MILKRRQIHSISKYTRFLDSGTFKVQFQKESDFAFEHLKFQ